MSNRTIIQRQRDQLVALDAELRAAAPLSSIAGAAVGRARSYALFAVGQLDIALRHPLDAGDGAMPGKRPAGAQR